jgi:hypothetical protein
MKEQFFTEMSRLVGKLGSFRLLSPKALSAVLSLCVSDFNDPTSSKL